MAVYSVAALSGLVLGRFLSVVVAAASSGALLRDAMGVRPGCGCRAGWRDYVPIVWWIADRGRCRRCGTPPGITGPLVEAVTAAVFVGAIHFVGPTGSLPAYLWFVSVTLVLGFIDLRHHLIPNRVLFPGIVVGSGLLAGGAVLDGRLGDMPEAAGTGLGYFVVLLVPAFLTRGAIGMGDVKLALLLGMFSGYGGWEVAVSAGVGAFLLAGVAAVILLALRRLARSDHIPFGPFMVVAAWIAIARDLGAG